MPLTRRGLLSSSAALAGSRLIATASVATLMTPSPARTEGVTAALAFASIVAGMVAAHNRRGDGPMFSALNQKVDVLIDQVANLQQSVTKVLDGLAVLPDRIDKLLKEEQTRRIHLAIQGVVRRYQTKIQPVRRNYGDLSAFRRSGGAMRDLQAVLDDLYREISILDAAKAYGPNTALLIPSARALEHALLELRGDDPRDIAQRLEQNLFWFDKVADPDLPTSVAAYRSAAIRRGDGAAKDASATRFGYLMESKSGTALFECAGVNDHRIASYDRDCSMHPKEPICRSIPIPERIGPRERMFANVAYEERPLAVRVEVAGRTEVRNTDFAVPQVTRSEPSPVLREGDPRVPAQCPQILVVDQEDPAVRAAWMVPALPA